MVQTPVRQVVLIAVFLQVFIHQRHRRRFAVIGTQVHDLDAEPLAEGEKFRRRAVQLFLSLRFDLGPLKIGFRGKIGQADDRDPMEAGFVMYSNF